MSKIIILDGATGTMLQRSGIEVPNRPEILAITNRDVIYNIHKAYVNAGSEIIYTNTFGANELKLEKTGYTVEEVVTAGIKVAKDATEGTNVKVAFDIGPLGELLEPVGTLTFERAYECYKRMAIAGEKAGADLVVIETMTDLYEVKSAVLAVKENTSLPVIVSMTFESTARTFTGCSVEAMAVLLEGLGVDAVGINCSLGPVEILPLAKILCDNTNLPVFIKPNAGLPNPENGDYDITPKEFASVMEKYIDIGVCMVGGCCGTTPEFIVEMKKIFNNKQVKKREKVALSRVSTATKVVCIDDVKVIGERINPTGKKLMREALKNDDIGYILHQAVEQANAGADILDVNVGAAGINEVEVLPKVIKAVQSVTDLPLQIDSSNVDAIEQALRVYNGKPIVNSVNGNTESLEKILPLCKKYGASVVGLTLDKNGVPNNSDDRFNIAKKILKYALSYGIDSLDVYIDGLTLTCSAEQESAMQTLQTIKRVKNELNLKTVLGVSNISFGLPNRELLNHSFLLMALQSGLDLPIINPNSNSMMDAVRAFRVFANRDKNSTDYIKNYKDYIAPTKVAVGVKKEEKSDLPPIIKAILDGLDGEVKQVTIDLLQTLPPMEIVNKYLIPALDLVGEDFEKGKLFLPQLLKSASTAQVAFDEVKKSLPKEKQNFDKSPIMIATVEGDIHDIGKNIVKVILENYGYNVIDLGRDVKVETVVSKAQQTGAKLIGLSALMTTTLASMERTIIALKQANIDAKIMVGGAVLTEEYALKIGADYYSKDAKQAVDIAKKVIG